MNGPMFLVKELPVAKKKPNLYKCIKLIFPDAEITELFCFFFKIRYLHL